MKKNFISKNGQIFWFDCVKFKTNSTRYRNTSLDFNTKRMKEYKILETSKQATDEQEHNYKCPACKGIKKRYALTLNI